MYSKNKNRGFTLLELVIVIAITGIIVTALIISQNNWNNQLAVNTQAYEAVLLLRQAQIHSLGVREDVTGTGDKFNIGYGVNFNINLPAQYIYFADRNGDGVYNYHNNLTDGVIETKSLNRGVVISKICGYKNGVGESCSDNSALRQVDISFLRPEPKANIVFRGSAESGGNIRNDFSPPVLIYFRSTDGVLSLVKVETNGQISITQ